MKSTTIKDVANRLKVSISTVSRAFNNTHDVKEETRARILQTAKEMGYYPNPIAKKLTQSKTFNVGVVVPEFINEYYSEVIRGIQHTFLAKGYQVLIMQSDDNPEVELRNVKTLVQNKMDGLVICPSVECNNMEYYMEEIGQGYPIVFLNRLDESLPVNKVLFNNEKWSFFATEHLIYQGYKKIYHLSGKGNLGITKKRTSGFVKAMRKHHRSEDQYKVIETGLIPEEAMGTVQKLVENHDLPDAFMCVNDLVALSTIAVLKDYGITVPGDIGVMGFTEMKIANLVSPKLSSVKQPAFEMGQAAAEMLVKILDGEEIPEQTIILDGLLNIRESSLRKMISSFSKYEPG